MSRSPYNAYKGSTSGRGSGRGQVETGSFGDGSNDWGSAWGLSTNSVPRANGKLAAPKPPSEPSPPPPSSGVASKPATPMAFRSRRFSGGNGSVSGSYDSAQSLGNGEGPSTSSPAPTNAAGKKAGSPLQPQQQQQANGHAGTTGGSGGASSSGTFTAFSQQQGGQSSGRDPKASSSPAAVLAAYIGGGGALTANPPAPGSSYGSSAKALRPKSTSGERSSNGNAAAKGANRLSEEGHAAGHPTLSLREKVVVLQKANRQLEQQLAELAAQAEQQLAAAKAAHDAQLAAEKKKHAALEQELAAAHRAAQELSGRNAALLTSQTQVQSQLAELKRQQAAAVASASSSPSTSGEAIGPVTPSPSKLFPPLGSAAAGAYNRDREQRSSILDMSSAALAAMTGDLGPSSPRTPHGSDTSPTQNGAGLSPSTSSISTVSATSDVDKPARDKQPAQRREGSSADKAAAAAAAAGSNNTRTSSDDAANAAAGLSAAAAQPQSTSPRSQPHAGSSAPAATGSSSSASSSSSPFASAAAAAGMGSPASRVPNSQLPPSLRVDPLDSSLFANGAPPAPIRTLERSQSTPALSAMLAAHPPSPPPGMRGSSGSIDVGVAPPSPLALAAGLSGAGVALLAKQRKQLTALRVQLQQKESAYAFLANEHAELEGQLKEVEAAKREYAARYAFMLLDQDLDGHVRVDQVRAFEMFSCYAAEVVEYAFKHWRFASGFKGYLNMDDFIRFVNLADERGSRDSQRFWFAVLDLDGDGHVGPEDAKWFYDAVDKEDTAFVVSFEDLWHQLADMTQPSKRRKGFTAGELWKCKLGAGVVGLLLNHNNMLLHRTTAEWGRGDFPL